SLGLLSAMRGTAIDDQEYLLCRAAQQSLQELDKHPGVDAALRDHEAHMSLRCDGRNQTKAETRSCSSRDDRRFANLAPCSARVMIRAHMRAVIPLRVEPGQMRFKRTLAAAKHVIVFPAHHLTYKLSTMTRAPDDLFDRHALFRQRENGGVGLLAMQKTFILDAFSAGQ